MHSNFPNAIIQKCLLSPYESQECDMGPCPSGPNIWNKGAKCLSKQCKLLRAVRVYASAWGPQKKGYKELGVLGILYEMVAFKLGMEKKSGGKVIPNTRSDRHGGQDGNTRERGITFRQHCEDVCGWKVEEGRGSGLWWKEESSVGEGRKMETPRCVGAVDCQRRSE